MHIILGATGHVGSAVLCRLLREGEPVLAVAHSATHEDELRCTGAEVATVDIRDTDALTKVMQRGQRAFLLNPPGRIEKDSVAEELATVNSIVTAVQNADLEYVVAASTQGAQPGRGIGDLGVLFEFEQRLKATGVPTSITRGAYYYSNWDMQLESARNCKIQSFFPADFKLPMVAPEDLGALNGNKLLYPFADRFAIDECSGPEDYSAQDVADAFAQALDRDVEVETIPREKWIETYRTLGFSEASARSYAKMTEVIVDHAYESVGEPKRGAITLQQHIEIGRAHV